MEKRVENFAKGSPHLRRLVRILEIYRYGNNRRKMQHKPMVRVAGYLKARRNKLRKGV